MSGQVQDYITDEQAQGVFDYLDKVVIRLEGDPTVLGPSYVHQKLMECRDHSNEVERLLVRYYDVERRVRNVVAARAAALKAHKSELLAINPDVRSRKSAADRDAYSDYLLRVDIEELEDLREQMVNVQYVLKAIDLKKEGLNRTNNDIKKQVALMEFAKGAASMHLDEYESLSVVGDEAHAVEATDDAPSVLGTSTVEEDAYLSPTSAVDEDDDVLAFLNSTPVSPAPATVSVSTSKSRPTDEIDIGDFLSRH